MVLEGAEVAQNGRVHWLVPFRAVAVTAASARWRLHRMRRETYADLDLWPSSRLRVGQMREVGVRPLAGAGTPAHESVAMLVGAELGSFCSSDRNSSPICTRIALR